MVEVFQFYEKYSEAVSYLNRNKYQLPPTIFAEYNRLLKVTEELDQPKT